jgi:hypothetical protein
MAATKRCGHCGIEQPESAFFLDKRRKDGLYTNCKSCHTQYTNAWKARNRERVNAIARKSQSRPGSKARARQWAKHKYQTDPLYRQDKIVRAVSHYYANLADRRAYHARRRAEQQDKIRQTLARWYTANAESVKARVRDYGAKNQERLRPYHAARQRKRYALKMQAIPRWADIKTIKQFYKLAADLSATTGVAHHVDHIVPLKSRVVCGLHVEANLRVIPGLENQSKGNRHWPGGPPKR